MHADREAVYRALFETTLDGIMIVNDEGRYVEVNDSLCRLLKASREQLVGAHFSQFMPSGRLDEASADFGELKSMGSFQGEFPMRALDGSVVELEWTSRADFLPGLHFCVARDITARKQVQRELQRRQEELTDFIENATVGLHWVGPDGTILWANRAELELLGYTAEEYIGHHIAEFHADPPVIEDILHRLAAREELHSYEARLRCKDGSLRYVLISSNVRWDGDQFIHTRCFTRDITERRRAEDALKWTDRRLAAEHAVSQLLAHATSLRVIAPRLLQALCEGIECEVGELWEVEGDVLRCTGMWTSSPAPEVRQFQATCHDIAFAPGVGLPGRVWQQREATTIPDLAVDDNFPRGALARAAGLCSALAVPLMLGTQAFGVIEFFTRQPFMPEADLLAMLTAVGQEIGLFVSRRRTEQALAAEQKRLSLTLASIGDGVIVTDHAGRATFLNPVAESLTGWGSERAAGQPLAEVFRIVNETTRQPVESPVERALRDGVVVGLANHTVLLARDGREHAIDDSAAPIRDEDGKIAGAVLVFRDISERRRLEIAARRLAAIVESSDDAIVSKDLNGIVTSWNKAAERIFGYTAEEMIGRPIALLVPPERPNEESAILERLRRGERIDHYETVRVRKDGSRLDVSVTISPVRDADGRIVGASKVARNITESKRMEQELRERAEALVEADRAKDDFLAMLAHELRNPLASIRNALYLLRLQGEDLRRREQVGELLARQVGHMTRMIDDLLDVSRITRGKVVLQQEPLDLTDLIRLTMEDQRAALEQAGLTTKVALPDAPVWIRGDATRLTQVLDNLLENARKFTDRGGQVTVTLGVDAADSPRRHGDTEIGGTEGDTEGDGGRGDGRDQKLRSSPNLPLTSSVSPCLRGESAFAVITVKDTGIGIEPEVLPRLFDVFAQADRTLERSRGGLGLGLALVKGLVELHHGTVSAASEGPGQGAAFTVRLPLAAAPAADLQLSAGAESEPLTRRVLLIEDNRDAAETLRELLELHGCAVSVAHTGPAGLELARRTRPEVIVCDIGLPGMDGYAVATALRQEPALSRTLLLAMSGYGQEEDQRRSREAGFDGHLVKPVDFDTLLGYLQPVVSE